MTLDQLQYAAVIFKQFFDNTSPLYLISIKPDAIYKLADIRGKILTEKKSLGIYKQLGN